MENETWMNARKAVELGFADEILFADGKAETQETEEGESDGKETEAVWQPYSTRVMGQTILNRLGCTAEAPALADEEPVEAKGEAQDVEPSEAGLTDMFEEAIGEAEPDADTPSADEVGSSPTVENTAPKVPLIGMDGKTPDGAMPYELLRKQLDFLR
jgi:hypothetical protein